MNRGGALLALCPVFHTPEIPHNTHTGVQQCVHPIHRTGVRPGEAKPEELSRFSLRAPEPGAGRSNCTGSTGTKRVRNDFYSRSHTTVRSLVPLRDVDFEVHT